MNSRVYVGNGYNKKIKIEFGDIEDEILVKDFHISIRTNKKQKAKYVSCQLFFDDPKLMGVISDIAKTGPETLSLIQVELNAGMLDKGLNRQCKYEMYLAKFQINFSILDNPSQYISAKVPEDLYESVDFLDLNSYTFRTVKLRAIGFKLANSSIFFERYF